MAAPRKDEEAASHIEPEKRHAPSSASSSDGDKDHYEDVAVRQSSVAAKLRNPLVGMSEEHVLADADAFVDARGLEDKRDAFRKGALLARVAQRENGFENVSMLSEEEKGWLRDEITHRWRHPFQLYFLVILCAGSAIVQGMDQTAVNGTILWDGRPTRELQKCFGLPWAHLFLTQLFRTLLTLWPCFVQARSNSTLNTSISALMKYGDEVCLTVLHIWPLQLLDAGPTHL